MKIKPALLAIALLAIDQTSKYFFYDKGLLSNLNFISPSFNLGISWSLPVHLYIVISISILAATALFILYKKEKINWIVFSFLLSGTLGNLIDRVALGGVRDFINIQIFNFPIFNIADVLLNIGIIVLIIQEFRLEKKSNKTKK